LKPARFAPAARLDLLSIGQYIALDNPRRAITFVDEIEERCNRLGEFPGIARRLPALGKNARVLVFKGYLILYRDLPDHVAILRVIHGARDLAAILEEWDEPE
jgi:toxin ParE1/3/4